MNRHGLGVMRLVNALHHEGAAKGGNANSSTATVVSAPTAILVDDPMADVEAIVDAFHFAQEDEDGPRPRRPANSWLQRRRNRQRVSHRESGLLTYDGRLCCMQHLEGVNKMIDRLRLPHRTTCPTCRATFEIEQRVRRAHG